jgi:hypothetical protein
MLHPSKDPGSLLTSQRGKQKQAAPLCLPVPVTYHLKGDGRGLVALARQSLRPCSNVRVWPSKYLLNNIISLSSHLSLMPHCPTAPQKTLVPFNLKRSAASCWVWALPYLKRKPKCCFPILNLGGDKENLVGRKFNWWAVRIRTRRHQVILLLKEKSVTTIL